MSGARPETERRRECFPLAGGEAFPVFLGLQAVEGAEATETENHPLSGWTTKRLYLKNTFSIRRSCSGSRPHRKGVFMAKEQNLAHTKWLCRYHIVFTPKYRRKVIYGQYREEIGKIIRQLCKYKGIEIIEGHMMIDHVHMLVMIPPKYAISSVMGYIKGKSSLMIFDKFSQLKYRYGNRRFWSVGYYVSTVGLNEVTIRKYIREEDREDIMLDKRTCKEYTDPFSPKQGKLL